MPSDVEICSKALSRLGGNSISSFLEGSTGPLCAQVFPEVKLRVLTSGPWRFNTVKSQLLNRSILTPPTEYKFIYELPTDMLTGLPRTVWNSPFNQGRSSQFTDFNIFESGLYTSAEQILIDYPIDRDSQTFPPHLTVLAIYAMAAEIALPVTDQQNTADAWEAKAWGGPEDKGKGGYFRTAQRIDSQGHPSQAILNYPLTAVRHGGL